MGDTFDEGEQAGGDGAAAMELDFEFPDDEEAAEVPAYLNVRRWSRIRGAQAGAAVPCSVTDEGTMRAKAWFGLDPEQIAPLAQLLVDLNVNKKVRRATLGCGLWPKTRRSGQLYVVDSDGFNALLNNRRVEAMKAKDESAVVAAGRWLMWLQRATAHLLSLSAPSSSAAPTQTSSDTQYQMGGESNAAQAQRVSEGVSLSRGVLPF